MDREPCNSILETLDIYNRNFPLRIFGKEKYSTKAGSILGIMSILGILAFSMFFLLELFARKSVMIVYNKNTNFFPVINLTNAAFMVAVTDKTGIKLPVEGVYNLEIKMMHYYLDRGNIVNVFNSTNIEFELCNEEKHDETYNEIFKTIQYPSFYCVAIGRQNKTLYGKLGDFPNGFSLLGVYINRCNPKQQKCLDDNIVEHHLSDFVVGITYSSFNVDHYNFETPNTQKFENNGVFPMTLTLLKCYFYNLAQVIYETDYGLVFEQKQVKDFYEYESQTVDVNMPGTTNNFLFGSESTVGYILFKCSENVSFFYRSYGKAQAVIANIGGVIKAMLVLTKVTFNFFTRKCILVDLANSFFQFSNEDDTNQKIVYKKNGIINVVENDDYNNKNNNKYNFKSLSHGNEILIRNSNSNKKAE